MLLGSVEGCVSNRVGEMEGEHRRTVRIELEDLQVHIGVCDDDVQLFFEGEEISGHTFEVVFAPAEDHHLVRLFLLGVSDANSH
jgi:hypothetical protein